MDMGFSASFPARAPRVARAFTDWTALQADLFREGKSDRGGNKCRGGAVLRPEGSNIGLSAPWR
jgi:hypothetical protein